MYDRSALFLRSFRKSFLEHVFVGDGSWKISDEYRPLMTINEDDFDELIFLLFKFTSFASSE